MAKLHRFSTPADLEDRNPDAWSDRVKAIFDQVDGNNDFPQLYDPTEKNTPVDVQRQPIAWVAFPKLLRATQPLPAQRWKTADGNRGVQDEYCEWSVKRRKGKIVSITFTTETPEYWEHLFHTDPKKLVALYRRFVDPKVELADLRNSKGGYLRANKWNSSQPGRLAHLVQPNNNLFAAVALVAAATVPRVKGGKLVTHQQALMQCSGLGEPLRNSDPQIAFVVNDAARTGAEITLANPIGLYMGKLRTAGMVTPDGADAAKFWKVERGDATRALRARFEVPPKRGYVVGDIKVDGRPIEFGGQVAELVRVRIGAWIKKGSHKATPQPCEG
jgi:hypothetical protein